MARPRQAAQLRADQCFKDRQLAAEAMGCPLNGGGMVRAMRPVGTLPAGDSRMEWTLRLPSLSQSHRQTHRTIDAKPHGDLPHRPAVRLCQNDLCPLHMLALAVAVRGNRRQAFTIAGQRMMQTVCS